MVSAGLGLGLLTLVKAGICPCTAFTGASLLLVILSVLLVGNRAFGALTMEREKKTLDCLRLTQWSAPQVLYYKLAPELHSLYRVLLVLGPSVLILGGLGDAGIARALGVILMAFLGGLASAVFGIFVSSMSDTTSQAYVAGRVGKSVWLLLTPVLDKLLSAVLVSTKAWPVFTTLNPWAATWGLAFPESSTGLEAALPVLTMIALPVVTAGMWWMACRRFESGMIASPSLTDRRVHPLYRGGRNYPEALRGNPAFLRELALQLRSGAGRWPGYMVFFVLFLAPFLYAQSWSVKAQLDYEQTNGRRRAVHVEGPSSAITLPQGTSGAVTHQSQGIALRSASDYRVHYILKDHTAGTCLRMLAYQWWNMPLPAHELVKVVEEVPTYQDYSQTDRPTTQTRTSGPREQQLSSQEAAQIGAAGMYAPTQNTNRKSQRPWSISMVALGMGLTGGITLLLIYLGIRCSGFLAAAVTGEKERCTWNDLILSGMSPVTLLTGKLAGSLAMPMLQMSVAFPSLLLFVAAGAVGIFGALGLYAYTVGVACLFALLGLWSSVTSETSHESHTKALLGVLLAFGAGTLVSSSSAGASLLTGCLLMVVLSGGRSNGSRALVAGGLAVIIAAMCPAVVSPLSATHGFLDLPSLDRNFRPTGGHAGLGMAGWVLAASFLYCWAVVLWETVVSRLSHSADANVLENERAA